MSKEASHVDKEDYDKIAKPFKESNWPKLIDPLNTIELIPTLEAEIDEFESQVDMALSEINVRTEIEIK